MAALADTGVSTAGTLYRDGGFAQRPLTNLLCEGAQPSLALLHGPILGDRKEREPPPCSTPAPVTYLQDPKLSVVSLCLWTGCISSLGLPPKRSPSLGQTTSYSLH